LFEPPGGEFGPGQRGGTGSSRGDLTPKWVLRAFFAHFLCTSKESGSAAGPNSRRALTQ
jgi:hypothetical protein